MANEYETHPDGRYRLDQPDDVQWARATARFVKQLDPYGHPVTVHPVVSSSTKGASPRDPYESPWRIGEFFGEGDEIDVLSHQTGQQGNGTAWDETLQCWTGDSAELVASLHADRRYRKPVLNTENGYEYLRGQPTENKQVHHTDKVRRSAWRIVCAGGYFGAGFNGTIGHSDIWNRIDAPNRYFFLCGRLLRGRLQRHHRSQRHLEPHRRSESLYIRRQGRRCGGAVGHLARLLHVAAFLANGAF